MVEYRLRIRRFNPERDQRPYWQQFTVRMEPTDRLLDALQHVKDHQDGSLTFRRSCGHGVCGSDAMTVNGVSRLACGVLLGEAGRDIRIEPLRGFRVIKDLVVDMEDFFRKYRAVKPYLIHNGPLPEKEHRQTPAQHARFDETTKCILCAVCAASCPIFRANKQYLGPAALVNAHRFLFDSRDEGTEERLQILNQRDGVWGCRTILNCSEDCPRGIDVTQAIEEIKRLLLYSKL